MKVEMLTVRDREGHMVQAPLIVWMQALFQSLPPEWQMEVMTTVAKWQKQYHDRPRVQVVAG